MTDARSLADEPSRTTEALPLRSGATVTSLRASSCVFGEAQSETTWLQDDENAPTAERPSPHSRPPRVVQRAALSVSCAEDLLAACIAAQLVAGELGLGQETTSHAVRAVSELGQNMLRHAARGTIALAQIHGTLVGIEVLAQDQGPGIRDLTQVLERCRGVSGAGSSALRRMSLLADEFDVHSGPTGTHVRFVIYG